MIPILEGALRQFLKTILLSGCVCVHVYACLLSYEYILKG